MRSFALLAVYATDLRMSLERDHLAEEGRMNRAFGDESVFKAPEQELRLYLKVLCREAVPNEWCDIGRLSAVLQSTT
jgi:hypothetical protein